MEYTCRARAACPPARPGAVMWDTVPDMLRARLHDPATGATTVGAAELVDAWQASPSAVLWMDLMGEAAATDAALVWSVRRGPATPLIGDRGSPSEILAPLLAAALVIAAVWLSWGAFRALGVQWSLEARVLSDHDLVTSGPYRYVRHPIYAAVWAHIPRPWAR